MEKLNNKSFSPSRFLLWPIYSGEARQFVPMLIILFLLSFNQSALWNIKDALVITSLGAEVIPFIKVWAILPGAILVTFLFTQLSNRYSQEKVFYIMTSTLLLFYALFAFVIYPGRDYFELTDSADYLESVLPTSWKGLALIYRHWTFTAFYVACELWTTIVISLLFWRFANEVTRLSQANRFYGTLSIIYNLAIVVAGMTTAFVLNDGALHPYVPLGDTHWDQAMMLMIVVILANGLLAMMVFRWTHQRGVEDSPNTHFETATHERLSLRQCLVHVCQSKYLMCLAALVLAYSLVINLVEVVWKDQLRQLYPHVADYNRYISYLQIVQGSLAIILSLSIAPMIQRAGWTKVALVTPLLMVFCCVMSFGILLFQEHLYHLLLAIAGTTPLAIVVFFGSLQNCMSKACKYSLFDSTKEMAFTPLSHDSKLQGKTAIDGIGVRLGKSGSSVILQGMLLLFASISASAPYVALILLAAFALWIASICYLGRSAPLHAHKQGSLSSSYYHEDTNIKLSA